MEMGLAPAQPKDAGFPLLSSLLVILAVLSTLNDEFQDDRFENL